MTEMGGKNTIIVTANAELDETVSGIIYSAFAHAGQKMLVREPVIVHASVIDRLAERRARFEIFKLEKLGIYPPTSIPW